MGSNWNIVQEEETFAVSATEMIVDKAQTQMTEENPRTVLSPGSVQTFFCRNYKSVSGCKFCPGTVRLKGSREKWWISCFAEEVYAVGFRVSRHGPPRMSVPLNSGKLGSHRAVTFPRAHGTTQTFGQDKVHRKESCKIVNLKNAIHVRQNLRRGHKRRPCTTNDAPAEQRVIWRKNVQKLKNKDKATFSSPTETWVMPAPSSKEPEEREFVVDSGASMLMLSKKELRSAELESLRKSRNPGRSANKRRSTILRSRSKSVRDSAITRRNACCSIAWKTLALLKERCAGLKKGRLLLQSGLEEKMMGFCGMLLLSVK